MAHGYYEEQHVHDLHAWMQQEMQRHGAHIDSFEHCPFHPEGVVEGYSVESEFRKPQPGMILKLQREWTTDPSSSFVVGDRDTDVEAAIAAGVAGYKFEGGNLSTSCRSAFARGRSARSGDADRPPIRQLRRRGAERCVHRG